MNFKNLINSLKSHIKNIGNDSYQTDENYIVKNKHHLSNEKINSDNIISWQVKMEMGFDIVIIEMSDGSSHNWFDQNDDLITILKTICPNNEVNWSVV